MWLFDKFVKQTGLFFLLCFCLFGCSSDGTPVLRGRWEMFVGVDSSPAGRQMGITDLCYVMELNSVERIFEPEADLSGRKSYGFMDFSNASRYTHFDIDSVYILSNNRYRIVSIDPNRSVYRVDTLKYEAQTKEITLGAWVFKYKTENIISQTVSDEQSLSTDTSGSSWFWLIFRLLLAVIGLALVYYLVKILMGYFFMMLGAAAIGAAIGGLILWVLMGGFDLDLPRWLIIIIMSVTTVPIALVGLWEALKSTGELARMPFATRIAEGLAKAGKSKYGNIVDEYGNKTQVTDVKRGMFGERYIETEDGRNFIGNSGANEVHEV